MEGIESRVRAADRRQAQWRERKILGDVACEVEAEGITDCSRWLSEATPLEKTIMMIHPGRDDSVPRLTSFQDAVGFLGHIPVVSLRSTTGYNSASLPGC